MQARASENVLLPMPARVLHSVKETPDSITLDLDLNLNHRPGQFIQISIMGVGEAPISIASWGGNTTTLHIRQVGNVTAALGDCQAGDTLFVRGPYGNGFPMDETWKQNLLLVGGGCGVAPLRGVIQHILHHRADYGQVLVFVGFHTPGELLFERDIERWSANCSVHVSFDNMDTACSVTATEGFVTELVRQADLPPGETTAFLCGPPIMMSVASDVLLEKGLPEERLYLSMERLMYCSTGECCHCMIGGKYACVDGPVFPYTAIKEHVRE
jgi:sulfite reductase subunit B